MARRKKRSGGVSRFAIGTIVIIIISIGIFVGLPFLSTGTFSSPFNYYAEQNNFGLTLVPNVNILCTLDTETDFIDINNNRFTFTNRQPEIIDTFTNFQVVGLVTTSSELKLLDPEARIKCDPQTVDVTINLVGGWVQTRHEVQDQNGNFQLISSVTKQIPDISRSIKGRSIEVPTDDVTAQEIENRANIQNVLSKNVQVRTQITGFFEIQTSATGTLLNTGSKLVASAGYVKIINQVEDPVTQGMLVDITSINPTSFCHAGSGNTCGSASVKQVPNGGTMTMTVKGELDNWTTSEGAPFIRIIDPRGQQVGSNIVMTTARDIGGGTFEFSRINFDIARTISEQNIVVNKGTWFVEMHSNGDVRKDSFGRTITDRKSFILQDQTPIDTTPNCDPNTETFNQATGMCEPKGSTTPPEEPVCPTPQELQTTYSALSLEELALGLTALTLTEALSGGLDTCQQTQLNALEAEFDNRGEPIPEPTPVGTEGLVAKIRYIANYEPAGAESNEGCQDIKTVPEAGVGIQTFQLIGIGGATCDNFRFGNIEIRPILDFGGTIASEGIQITKSSVDLDHTLFMSVNNPFPSNPTYDCNITSAVIPPTCTVDNHDFTNDPIVSLSSNEVITIAEPTDRDTSGEYQLSLVELDASALEQKLKNAGISLKEGDKYSYMILLTGTFDATKNGVAFKGVIPPITFSQQFTFQEFGGIVCDNETEAFDQIKNECVPLPPDTCTPPAVRNVISQLCEIPPDNGGDPLVCPEIPVCQSNENLVVLAGKDVCGINSPLECRPIEGEPPVTNGDPPVIVPPTSNGGCPPLYQKNTVGNCQLIGSGTTCVGAECNPNVDTTGGGLCTLDSDFNFAQCFASVFSPEGDAPSLTLEGASGTAVLVAGLVIVLLIVIAVVVRIRRGKGFPV